jgi:hypothetical protein
MSEFQQKIRARLRALQLREPPAPWRRISAIAIGGLTEVGFAVGTDLLLVLSAQGRGLFDCATGERLARDYEEPTRDSPWYGDLDLWAMGIGPLQGQRIGLAGIFGGGLRRATADGWGLELVSPDWPESFVVIYPPSSRGSVFDDPVPSDHVRVAPQFGSDDIRCGHESHTRTLWACVTGRRTSACSGARAARSLRYPLTPSRAPADA